MKEKDILHENGDLWVCKDKALGFVLNKSGAVMSIGFLSFATLEQAIDNCDSLAGRADLVERLLK